MIKANSEVVHKKTGKLEEYKEINQSEQIDPDYIEVGKLFGSQKKPINRRINTLQNFRAAQPNQVTEDRRQFNRLSSSDYGDESYKSEINSIYDAMVDRQYPLLLLPKEQCIQTLLEMDFKNSQIQALFLQEPQIQNIEQALQKFEKTDLGYQHQHAGSPTGNCEICFEKQVMHYEYNLQRLEQGESMSAIKQDLMYPQDEIISERASSKQISQETEIRAEPVEEGIYCPICCENYEAKDILTLKGCKHEFCKNCLVDHLKLKITEGQVFKIPCIEYNCNCQYLDADIQFLGSQKLYNKYLRFVQNINVEVDKNLKWCPRVGCLNYVRAEKTCCWNKSNAKCVCGQKMCFKCGAVKHTGVNCDNVGNAELREYMANNDVVKCPNCGFGTEKIDGCNHMTCAKCNFGWCWICRGKYRSGHFSEINIFGCPGDQFTEDTQCCNFMKKVLLLVAIPFILFFAPMVLLWIQSLKCWPRRRIGKSLSFFIVFLFVQLPLILTLGAAAGLVLLVVLSIPAYLLQIWRLLKIIFRKCDLCCCLRCLPCLK